MIVPYIFGKGIAMATNTRDDPVYPDIHSTNDVGIISQFLAHQEYYNNNNNTNSTTTSHLLSKLSFFIC